MSRFAGTPAEKYMPAGWGDKILHTMLVFDGGVLMGSDDNHHQTPQGMSVCLQVDEPAEAERIFGALVESGSVRMPLAKTFWAERFGMLTDRFGVPWIVNCAGAAQQAAA